MFTVCRSAGSVPSSAPAASPRVRRRHSSWPPGPASITVPEVASPSVRSACTAARPTSARFEPVPRLRRFNHWFTLVTPSRLVRRTRTIWQYWPVPALSGLLPTLTSTSWVRLPSTSIRPLRRRAIEVSHPRSYTQRLMAHLHDVEGVEHGDRILELVVDGVLVARGTGPGSRPARRPGTPRPGRAASRRTPARSGPGRGRAAAPSRCLPGARARWRVRSTIPVSSFGRGRLSIGL